MPNIITHTIFCEKVFHTIKQEPYKSYITNHKKEYLIGTNGPDFLFFYGIFPLYKKFGVRLAKMGTSLHNKKINAIYESMIQTYLKQESGPLKEAMASYLIAHYLHWQLDSVMHPYVVYRTGFKDVRSKYHHHRFESMMDTMLLKYYYDEDVSTFKTYKLCETSPYTVDVIANLYIPAVQTCLEEELSKEEIKKSLFDWYQTQKYLYDPNEFKFKCVRIFENVVHKKWVLSGNIVPLRIDKQYDILNKEKRTWLHPCLGIASNDTVFDLMDTAIAQSKIGLPLLFAALEGKEIQPFLQFLDNKTYSNGINTKKKRMYKDVIYKE